MSAIKKTPLVASVDAAALRDAMARGVYGKANDNAITRHVLLQDAYWDQNPMLRITTTDTRMEVTQQVPCGEQHDEHGYEDMAVAADAQKLRGALFGLSGEVHLEETERGLLVKAGGRRFVVPTLPADDWPGFERLDVLEVPCDPKALADAMGAVAYAAGVEDVRVFLNGIHVAADAVMAADGHRMARVRLETRIGLPEGERVIVPPGAVKTLMDALSEPGARLQLLRLGTSAASAVQAGGALYQVRVRLVGTKAPELEKVLPATKPAAVVRLKAPGAAEAAIARVMTFCGGDKWRIVHCVVDGSTLRVVSQPAEDYANDEVECEADGAHVVAMNAAYLRDALAKAKGAEVVWKNFGADSVQIIEFDGRDEQHAIMPWKM